MTKLLNLYRTGIEKKEYEIIPQYNQERKMIDNGKFNIIFHLSLSLV